MHIAERTTQEHTITKKAYCTRQSHKLIAENCHKKQIMQICGKSWGNNETSLIAEDLYNTDFIQIYKESGDVRAGELDL